MAIDEDEHAAPPPYEGAQQQPAAANPNDIVIQMPAAPVASDAANDAYMKKYGHPNPHAAKAANTIQTSQQSPSLSAAELAKLDQQAVAKAAPLPAQQEEKVPEIPRPLSLRQKVLWVWRDGGDWLLAHQITLSVVWIVLALAQAIPGFFVSRDIFSKCNAHSIYPLSQMQFILAGLLLLSVLVKLASINHDNKCFDCLEDLFDTVAFFVLLAICILSAVILGRHNVRESDCPTSELDNSMKLSFLFGIVAVPVYCIPMLGLFMYVFKTRKGRCKHRHHGHHRHKHHHHHRIRRRKH